VAAQCMSLPVFPELSDDQVDTIVEAIAQVVG
jgi:dTDP-4-amino-4,6-dideoxygalactose transaminase